MNEVATFPPASPPWLPADDDVGYEIVNGKRVELPPMSAYETRLASILANHFEDFARSHQLGRAVSEMLFGLDPEGKLRRRPDVSYVSYKRWPRDRAVPRTPAWDVVPDLAVEIVSPTNLADEVVVKVQDYFRAGVQIVWVVYSVVRQVYVYESPMRIHVLVETEELDGTAIMPGFRLRVKDLFEEGTESG